MARMTNDQLTRWGARYRIGLADVKALRKLVNKRAEERVKACNGDPHPLVRDKTDKDANSEAWTRDSDATDLLLDKLAEQLGFDGVDYGVGVYPAFSKGNETTIHIPE